MANVALRQQLREALAANEALGMEVERLRAENAVLSARVAELADRVAALQAEASRDSTTSSKPPSTDPIEPRKSRAERRAEARAAKRRQGSSPALQGRIWRGGIQTM